MTDEQIRALLIIRQAVKDIWAQYKVIDSIQEDDDETLNMLNAVGDAQQWTQGVDTSIEEWFKEKAIDL